ANPTENFLPVTIPVTAQVGEFFEITTQYFNVCNPVTPVTTTSSVAVFGRPLAPANSTQTVCNGTTPSDFSINGVGAAANATVKWYANVSATTPKTMGTVGELITT